MRKSFWSVAFVAGILAVMSFGPPAHGSADVAQAAPSLVVSELDGRSFDLGRLRGKVVIVHFWATWCPPCRAEMPALDAFYRRYGSRGLEIIGLSVDRPRDRAEVVKMMRSFSFPAAMLNEAKVNDFGAPEALPVTFVFDGSGVVRAKLTPDETPITEKSLTDAVLPLLPGNPATHSSPDRSHSTDAGGR